MRDLFRGVCIDTQALGNIDCAIDQSGHLLAVQSVCPFVEQVAAILSTVKGHGLKETGIGIKLVDVGSGWEHSPQSVAVLILGESPILHYKAALYLVVAEAHGLGDFVDENMEICVCILATGLPPLLDFNIHITIFKGVKILSEVPGNSDSDVLFSPGTKGQVFQSALHFASHFS